MQFKNIKTINFKFAVPVVYNKTAFEMTLSVLRSGFDILSNNDIDLILKSNEFIRRKTFMILMNKYPQFKMEYIDLFMIVISCSN